MRHPHLTKKSYEPSTLVPPEGCSFMSYGETDRELTGNFIADHWVGRYSLPRSFWINGFLIAGVGGRLLVALISQLSAWGISLQLSAAIAIAAFALSIAIWVWSVVGIWRSAGYHTEQGGSSGWAIIARIFVILGALATFGKLVQSMPGLIETTAIATNNDTLGKPAYVAVKDDAITLSGPITLGTSTKFKKALESNPQVKLLKLSSLGGRIEEAQLLADIIRERGMDVETVGECSSACTIALLAGAKRWRKRKWIGFHQPSFPGARARDTAEMTNELREVYLQAGLPDSFIDKALKTSSQAMWYPNEMELFEANVLNHIPEERIRRDFYSIAYHANKNIPQKIDDLTELTLVEWSDDTLTKFYRVSASRSNFDMAAAEISVRASVSESLCSEAMVPQFMEAGAKYRFVYRDEDDFKFIDFTLTNCD